MASHEHSPKYINPWTEYIRSTLTDSFNRKIGIESVIEDYQCKRNAQHTDVAEFRDAIGEILGRVNELEPEVLTDAITITTTLKLWDFAPVVQNLKVLTNESLVQEVNVFFRDKEKHERVELYKRRQTTPTAFHGIIESLDLDWMNKE